MKIWYISPYASPDVYGWHSRTFIMSKYLASRGHKVTVFAFNGSHYFRLKVKPKAKKENIEGVTFRWLPSITWFKETLLIRLINWKLYNYFLKDQVFKLLNTNPDAIIFSIPSLHHVSLIPWFKIAFPNSKILFEIRDIWPLSVEQLSSRIPFSWFWKQMKFEEQTAMILADEIIAVQPGIVRYVKKYFPGIKTEKIHFIPHGIPTYEIVDSIITRSKYDICYAGTISRANDIQTLIQALILFKKRFGFELKVLVIGNGKNLRNCKNLARNLNQTVFTGWLPRSLCLEKIRQSQICFDGFLDLYLYEYGFSRLKWVDYLAMGKPIIASYSGSPIDVPINKIGWLTQAEDPQKLLIVLENIFIKTTSSRRDVVEKSKMSLTWIRQNRSMEILGKKFEKLIE